MLGSRKLHICPEVTKMESIIGHRIDYNGVGALRGQRHISSKNVIHVPPPGIYGDTLFHMGGRSVAEDWFVYQRWDDLHMCSPLYFLEFGGSCAAGLKGVLQRR